MANCKQCNKVFEAKRADALYCGDTCRQAAIRDKRRVTDNSVTDKSHRIVTDNETTEWPPLKATPVEWKVWMEEHRPNYLRILRSQSKAPPDVVERLAKTGTITYDGQGEPISWQGKNGLGRLITFNLGPYKSAGDLSENEYNRVALPGDIDYEGPKGPGVCCKCGTETQRPLITCCYSCAISKAPANHPQTIGAEA